MRTHFSWSRNAKLRATEKELRSIGFEGARVIGFGIPALRSADGYVTCPFAGACAGGCYARDGRYAISSVQQALERNLRIIRFTPPGVEQWYELIAQDLDRLRPTHVRLHTSGDFFSVDYLYAWQNLALELRSIGFYGYTKRPDAWMSLKYAKAMPSNWHIVQSEGGKLDGHLRDGRAHARVFESEEALAAAGYENCAHTDTALVLGASRVGLVLHGRKAKSRKEILVKAGWVHR